MSGQEQDKELPKHWRAEGPENTATNRIRFRLRNAYKSPPQGDNCANILRGIWDDFEDALCEAAAKGRDAVSHENERMKAEQVRLSEALTDARTELARLRRADEQLAPFSRLEGSTQLKRERDEARTQLDKGAKGYEEIKAAFCDAAADRDAALAKLAAVREVVKRLWDMAENGLVGDESRNYWKRTYENERLRQAFDDDTAGHDEGDWRACMISAKHLRDAMKKAP